MAIHLVQMTKLQQHSLPTSVKVKESAKLFWTFATAPSPLQWLNMYCPWSWCIDRHVFDVDLPFISMQTAQFQLCAAAYQEFVKAGASNRKHVCFACVFFAAGVLLDQIHTERKY